MGIFDTIHHGLDDVGHAAGGALDRVKGAGDAILHGGEADLSSLRHHVSELEKQVDKLGKLRDLLKKELDAAEHKAEDAAEKIKNEGDAMLHGVEGYFEGLLNLVKDIKNEGDKLKDLKDYIEHFGSDVMHALKQLAKKCENGVIKDVYSIERFIKLVKHYIVQLADLLHLPRITHKAIDKALAIEKSAYSYLSSKWNSVEHVSIDVFALNVHAMHGAARGMKAKFEAENSIKMPELHGIDIVDKLLDGLRALPGEVWHKISSVLNFHSILDFFQKVKDFFTDWKENGLKYDKLIILKAIGNTISSFIKHTKNVMDLKVQVGLLDFLKALVRGGEDSSTLEADADANTGAGGTGRFKLVKAGALVGTILMLIISIPVDLVKFMLDTHGAWIG